MKRSDFWIIAKRQWNILIITETKTQKEHFGPHDSKAKIILLVSQSCHAIKKWSY